MTSSRKPPHCKTCHQPLKGHKRDICNSTGDPSSPHSVSTKTQKSAPPPLQRLPTLSTESSQALNNILRTNSHAAPPVRVPESRGTGPRRSGRVAKRNESLREALVSAKASNEGQKPSEKITRQSRHNEYLAMPGTWEMPSVPQTQSHTSTPTWSSPRIVHQQLVNKASGKDSSPDPLTITISQQLKLEDSIPRKTCSLPPSDVVPPARLTIQNFLNSMAKNLQHPPATIFSYPINEIASLEDNIQSYGLCMHVPPLPKCKEGWSPVVIGRDITAITKLLEDGEELVQGLRRSNKSKVHHLDLGMSHVVVGALGALATWAGLAYS